MFPFASVRPVQRDFIDDVKDSLQNQKILLAHAPSGLGKTAATLAPALQYALENNKTIFFLTPRHSQHYIALETLKRIKEKYQVNFKVADMIGKKWLCKYSVDDLTNQEFNDFCNSMIGEERCGYFKKTRNKERILTKNAKIMLKILDNDFYHAEEYKEAVKDMCPYELLVETAKKSNVIIGDYYHLFSPARAILARLKKDIGDCILIVDEAHNLPERIRSIATSKITSSTIKNSVKEARIFELNDVIGMLEDIEMAFAEIGNELKDKKEAAVTKEILVDSISNKAGNIENVLEELHLASYSVLEQRKRSFIGNVARFLDSWIVSDEGYARIIRKTVFDGKERIHLINRCLEPMLYSSIINEAHSSILMSGTIQPLEMYKDILGLNQARTVTKSYISPFEKSNRLNIIINNTTTKYARRSENYEKIADYIIRSSEAIPGNMAVFFPSYKFRDIIYEMTKSRIKKIILLEKQSSKAEKRKLYDSFVSLADQGAILLGVQAGSFSEGVDLPGNYLNAVIIVGIPLEKPELETKALIDYYDKKFNAGWNYGYIYPAMQRCMQAAGRVIRSENDRGVAIFMDERFLWGNYRKFFTDVDFVITDKPEKLISSFFAQ